MNQKADRNKNGPTDSAEGSNTEEKFRALVQSVDGIVWEADATTFQFTFVSHKAEKLLGYPAASWYQPGFWEEHIHPDDREQATSYCIKSTLAKIPHEFEYRMIGAHGQVIWVRDIVTVMVEHDRPKLLRGIMVDITQHKSTEQALVESEKRFRTLMDSNIVGMVISTFDGKVIDANEAFLGLTGFDRQELRRGSVRWDTITPPEFHLVDRLAIQQIRKSGTCIPYEKQYIRRDGSRVSILIGAAKLSRETTIAFVLDLTERERLLAETRAFNRTIRFIAEFSKLLNQSLKSDEVVRLAADALVTHCCEWCMVFLVKPGESGVESYVAGASHVNPAVKSVLHQVLHKKIQSTESNTVNQVICLGQTIFANHVDQCLPLIQNLGLETSEWKEIESLACQNYVIAPLAASRRIVGALLLVSSSTEQAYTPAVLASVEDLARRLALAVENARLYEEAQTAIKMREEFLAIASHELRTPLTPLMLNIQLLKAIFSSGVHNPTAERIVGISEKQIKRISNMVNDLLDVSMIEEGLLQLHPVNVDLLSLVENVIERYEPQINASGNKVELKSRNAIHAILDPVRIEQVVENLLSNALKYGRKNPIELGLVAEDDKAILSVRDQGIGLSKDDVSKIFNPFVRAVAPGQFGGLGLGLYIVQKIIRSHGGTISVESQIGKGSCFKIELPLRGISIKAQNTAEKKAA